MPCQRIQMKDGTVVFAHLVTGATLTPNEEQAIAEYVQFCRDRRAKRKAREQKPKGKSIVGKTIPDREGR